MGRYYEGEGEGIQPPHFHSGESPPPPPWSAILDEGLMNVSF